MNNSNFIVLTAAATLILTMIDYILHGNPILSGIFTCLVLMTALVLVVDVMCTRWIGKDHELNVKISKENELMALLEK